MPLRLLFFSLIAGCSCSVAPADAGPTDAGVSDSGEPDGGLPVDAGHDAGVECHFDGECGEGRSCDVATGRCEVGCRTGAHVRIDVPAVELLLDVTLDGEPLPDSESGASLEFYPRDLPPAFGARYPLYDTESSAPLPARAVVFAPTVYEVFYAGAGRPLGDTEPLPIDGFVSLGTIEVAQSTTRVAIDIPRVRVESRVLFAGAPVTEAFTIALGGPRLGEWAQSRTSIVLEDAEASFWVVPGAYEARLGEWPHVGAIPFGSIDFSAGGSVAIDVPRAPVRVAATLDGAPLPAGASLVLRPDPPDRYTSSIALEPATDGSVSAAVVPGRYALRYVADPSAGPVADADVRTVEVPPLGLDISLDIPVAAVDLRVLGAGSGGACGASVSLTSGPTPWMRELVIDLGDPATPAVRSVELVRGDYDAMFRPSEDCADATRSAWPAMYAPLSSVAISADGPVDVAVPRQPFVVRPRIGGTAPTSPGGQLWLRWAGDVPSGATVIRGPIPLGAVDEVRVWVVPGVYSVHYDGAVSDASAWPNQARDLFAALDASAGLDMTIDFTSTEVELELTLGGQPLPRPEDRPPLPLHYGILPTIRLIGPVARFHEGQALSLWQDGQANHVHRFRAMPGRYDLTFDLGASWGQPRVDWILPPSGLVLGCWDVPPAP